MWLQIIEYFESTLLQQVAKLFITNKGNISKRLSEIHKWLNDWSNVEFYNIDKYIDSIHLHCLKKLL